MDLQDAELQEKLDTEFRKKYIDGRYITEFYNKYTETGIGSKEVLEFPDTDLHRKLYPELYNFEFHNFSCHIKRNMSGSWCGYATTEENHPLWKNKEEDIEDMINAHGGITYVNEKKFTIGFDCAHCFDEEPFRRTLSATKTYRTRDYVIDEVKSICLQLFNMLPKWSPSTHHLFPKNMQERYLSLYKIFYLRKQSPDLFKLIEITLWINIVANAY